VQFFGEVPEASKPLKIDWFKNLKLYPWASTTIKIMVCPISMIFQPLGFSNGGYINTPIVSMMVVGIPGLSFPGLPYWEVTCPSIGKGKSSTQKYPKWRVSYPGG